MDKLRNMEVFVTVAETGNFSAAAEKLGISAVMVGKHIQQLERHLSTRLVQRTTRKQNLTEAGAVFYENSKRVLEQVKWAESTVEGLQTAPSGLLRISAPVSLGANVVSPLLARYLEAFPHVQVELTLSNARVDLIEEGYDAAIRIGPVGDDRLVARPMKPYEMVICATPAYLKKYGTPATPEELKNHSCLIHAVWNHSDGWKLTNPDGSTSKWPLSGRYISNDGNALRCAALQDAGLLLQPKVLLADDLACGRMVSVMEDFVPVPRPISLVYLPDFRPRPKLTSLITFFAEQADY